MKVSTDVNSRKFAEIVFKIHHNTMIFETYLTATSVVENFGPVEISTDPRKFSIVGKIEISEIRHFTFFTQNGQKWGLDQF